MSTPKVPPRLLKELREARSPSLAVKGRQIPLRAEELEERILESDRPPARAGKSRGVPEPNTNRAPSEEGAERSMPGAVAPPGEVTLQVEEQRI